MLKDIFLKTLKMRFNEFMSKFGKGLKKGFQKVGSFAMKALPVVTNIARTVGGVMSSMPGKAGAIGTGIASVAAAGDGILNALPEGEIKSKAQHLWGTNPSMLPKPPSMKGGTYPPPNANYKDSIPLIQTY